MNNEILSVSAQNERIKRGWEHFRGAPLVRKEVKPPIFHGHPRVARDFSYALAIFTIRVFHNREKDFYADANQAIIDNSRFYIENTDVRDDRDSFYWNISEFCRVMLRYDSLGQDEAGLVSKEAEETFLEMALGYCKDNSLLSNAEWQGDITWNIYESENHHVQKNSALWQLELILIRHGLGGEILSDGGTVQEHFDKWSRFFEEWMRERVKRSMFVEIHSKVYCIHTIKNVMGLYDFAPSPELRRLTGDFLTVFWTTWAQEQINGIHGGGQSRIYPGSAISTSSEAGRWAWYYCGISSFASPGGMDYVLLDCGYRLPELIGQLIHEHEKRGRYVVESRPFGRATEANRFPDYRVNTEWGHIYRYSYCTPKYILGTIMAPQLENKDWVGISSQNRYQGVNFGVNGAVIALLPESTGLHAIASKIPTISYNAFWSMMRDTTLITQRTRTHKGGMRIFVSEDGGLRSSITEKGNLIFISCGDVYAALRICRGSYSYLDNKDVFGGAKGVWIVCDDGDSPVILEMGDAENNGSFEQFMQDVCALSPEFEGDTMRYHSLSGHDFVMLTAEDGNSTIDGEYYVKKIDKSFSSPFLNNPWGGEHPVIEFDGNRLELDFSELKK